MQGCIWSLGPLKAFYIHVTVKVSSDAGLHMVVGATQSVLHSCNCKGKF